MSPHVPNQPVASITRDQRQLLIYATAYRSVVAVLCLAMAASVVALIASVLSRIDQFFSRREVQSAGNSVWFLGGFAALVALLAAWNAVRIFRSALSLWGIGTYSLPFAIPTRATLIFRLAYGGFLTLPAILLVGELSAMPIPERYWIAIIGGPAAAAGIAALATAWRARTVLDRVHDVPDVSLVEEPQPYHELVTRLKNLAPARYRDPRRPG